MTFGKLEDTQEVLSTFELFKHQPRPKTTGTPFSKRLQLQKWGPRAAVRGRGPSERHAAEEEVPSGMPLKFVNSRTQHVSLYDQSYDSIHTLNPLRVAGARPLTESAVTEHVCAKLAVCGLLNKMLVIVH